ncbi:hypothetical protein AAHA92_22602 [Salvia divinorum]|uniref:Uncharacterized protein n=1 Tax=Salvia divinorum TaxID=28513 RepID=A0ABD1GS79_SALDI
MHISIKREFRCLSSWATNRSTNDATIMHNQGLYFGPMADSQLRSNAFDGKPSCQGSSEFGQSKMFEGLS